MPRVERISYNQYIREYRQKNREKMKEYDRKMRQKRRDENRCIRCGCPLIEDEKGYCIACKTFRMRPMIRGLI